MNLTIAKERLSSVVKPDSITTSQGDFLVTHVEIKKLVLLNKFELVPTSQKYTSEESIYKNYILNPENKHQFIVVYGQSGTGKSHLIRWFDAKFETDKPEDEVVLFIRRSDNTLKGTIRQLLQKPEVQGMSNKDILKRLTSASIAVPEDKLKDMIYHNFIIEINNDKDEYGITLNNIKRKRLVAFLNNDTIHDHMMSDDGPIERIYSKVAENSKVDTDTIAQFKPEDFIVSVDLFEEMQQAGSDPKAENMAKALMANDAMKDAEELCKYLNQFVSVVIQRCAGIEPGDFEQIFMDIRKELYRIGKNLTLFIEDVTSFTGVDNALLNALMEEHSDRDICRISSIVGGTSGYVNDCFRQNHQDRVTKYIYIPDDVFDEDGVVEFVGRYINAMSLSIDEVSKWISAQALSGEYPVHTVVEGKDWEYISINHGKKLCLYPFSKHSIKYLYENELTKGSQTPRYIIRDIIEPVISDLIYNPDRFPSIKYNLVNTNTTLSYMVHNQIKNDEEADRVFRFMSIWGNNSANQYKIDNVTYLAGLPLYCYEELGLPIINLQETATEPMPVEKPEQSSPSTNSDDTEKQSIPAIPKDKQKKLDDANAMLTQWANGKPINLSITGGTENTIRTAREDMGDFLLSTINWQSEGVSLDNVSKVKAAISGRGSRYKLVALENQTKGEGYYILPANWDSLNIICAFIRRREFGNNSWEYPGSDFDAYLITSWTSRIKNQIVKAVVQTENNIESKYIEAAIAAEMYRLILNGEYREKSLGNLTTEYLFSDHQAKNKNTFHCNEWNALLSVMNQEDSAKINRDTVKNYFKLIQGDKLSGSGVITLDAINLSKIFRKVKTNKLQISEEDILLDDRVKLRKDTFSFLVDIASRVNNVAQAELIAAKKSIQPIYDCFDDDEIEEEDIEAFLDKVSKFYKVAIEDTLMSIQSPSFESVKKSAKQISKAINDIGAVINEADTLTILMAFSGDPIGVLQPLLLLIGQVSKDIEDINKQLVARRSALGPDGDEKDDSERYKSDLLLVNNDIEILEKLR